MKTVLMVLGIIFAYFGMSLATYIIVAKIEHAEGDEPGDTERWSSFCWPIVLLVALVYGVQHLLTYIFDCVDKDIFGE